MATQYAKDQPSGYKNHVQNVAIVGATGSVGKYFVEELLKTGKHKVSAISRADSKASIPSGVEVRKVNYDDQKSLEKAMEGIDVLVITMGAMAPPEQQTKLIDAATTVGVPWIFPNEYSYDPADEKLGVDSFLGPMKAKYVEQLESINKSSYILFVNGFWYEFSLAGAEVRFGFDFPNKSVTFFDDGKVPINTTTWDLCGQAMAKLLSLKVLPEDANDKSTTLSQFRNSALRISSFAISQRDMFESVLRVTGEKESDWKITYQPVKERYETGVKTLRGGDRTGFVKAMYARCFYPGDEANYEKTRGTHNELLGLSKEDLDERTKVAVKLAESGPDGY